MAQRQTGFDEETAPAVTPERGGSPPGVTVAIKPIAKSATSAEITFTANEKAASTIATVVLVGTLKKGNQAIAQPAPESGFDDRIIERTRKPEGKKT